MPRRLVAHHGQADARLISRDAALVGSAAAVSFWARGDDWRVAGSSAAISLMDSSLSYYRRAFS